MMAHLLTFSFSSTTSDVEVTVDLSDDEQSTLDISSTNQSPTVLNSFPSLALSQNRLNTNTSHIRCFDSSAATIVKSPITGELVSTLQQQQQEKQYLDMQKRERERHEKLAAIRKQRFEREREFEMLRDLQRQELLNHSVTSSDNGSYLMLYTEADDVASNREHSSNRSSKHHFNYNNNQHARKSLTKSIKYPLNQPITNERRQSQIKKQTKSKNRLSPTLHALTSKKLAQKRRSQRYSVASLNTQSTKSNHSNGSGINRHQHIYVALPTLQAQLENTLAPSTYIYELPASDYNSVTGEQPRSSSDTHSYIRPSRIASLHHSAMNQQHLSWLPKSTAFQENFQQNSIVHANSYFLDNENDDEAHSICENKTKSTIPYPQPPDGSFASLASQRVKFARPLHTAISNRMAASNTNDTLVVPESRALYNTSKLSGAHESSLCNDSSHEFLDISSLRSSTDELSIDDDTSHSTHIDSEKDLARKALKSTDDPSLPCLTFRFWTISTLYVIFAAICSQLFYFRANFVAFSSFFVQFTAYPLGRLMEAILPTKNYSIGAMQFYLNPGPFNCKEHMLISVAVNAGGMAAYASDVIASEEIFFDLRTSSLLNLSILLTTQFIGFGLAGYLKEFLVRPTAMVWPVQLVQVTLYNTLHANSNARNNTTSGQLMGTPDTQPLRHAGSFASSQNIAKQRGLTRQRLFIIVFCAAFAYHLLPLTVMPVLTSLSLICLAMPHNEFAQLLGSGMRGLGMGTLSFDWAAIGSVAPMYTPWWAQVNFFLGAIGVLWVVAPLLWSFDIWYARMFPIVSAQLFDEQGQPFAVWHIITSTFSIDTKKLASYSQLRMSPVFAISFGATLFALAASCTHVALYYGKDMLKQLRASWQDHSGHHHKYQQNNYKPVHWPVYLGLFIAPLGGALIVCQLHASALPWWALLVSLSLAAIMALPIGIIQAVTNSYISIDVLLDSVCGFLYPSRPLASMLFKVYGTSTVSRSLALVSDMKLGEYMKVPPRKLLIAQLWGSIVGVFINYGVITWVLQNKLKVLSGATPDSTGGWDPRNTRIFYSSAIIWNVVGPESIFGTNSPYRLLWLVVLAGLLLPIPFYLLHRRYPTSKWRLVNLPLMALGASAVPKLPANFLLSSFIVAFVSQFLVRRCHNHLWKRYNYVFSAALDAGSQLAAVAVLMALSTVVFPVWWGNAKPNAEHCNLSLLAQRF